MTRWGVNISERLILFQDLAKARLFGAKSALDLHKSSDLRLCCGGGTVPGVALRIDTGSGA
jgi:hypothetical protein